ncbi:hypothetical protein [Flavobacterium cheniae]|jgi:hypothetical protein|uniref:Uncharacterized protein n=1 Tax=Flavobacterium cheniae TaxID=295428 RepID=A0A562KEP6_9FLAO|nr:hypothetical protein [Flavobacterium cheniae]TDR26200.1 hypothetical protein C8D80_0995 [Flavobacterium cheniae]TWH93876.1 hypothetical protein IP97_01823 [Flavobacterium cheniae]
MKAITTIIYFFTLISAQQLSSQNLELGVNEINSYKNENYVVPNNIEFIFSGNPRYIKYFFSDFEEKIKPLCRKYNIEFSLKYLDEKVHFTSLNYNTTNSYIVRLHIDRSEVIAENSGHNRIIKFVFSGQVKKNEEDTSVLDFTSIVKGIHDITNQNQAVADYVAEKIMKN